MAQRFLLPAGARLLSAAKIMRMSDNGVENVLLRLRWPETDGKPMCPGCGCSICCACRHDRDSLRRILKAEGLNRRPKPTSERPAKGQGTSRDLTAATATLLWQIFPVSACNLGTSQWSRQ